MEVVMGLGLLRDFIFSCRRLAACSPGVQDSKLQERDSRLDLLSGAPDIGSCGGLGTVGVEPDHRTAGGVDVVDPVAFAAYQRGHG